MELLWLLLGVLVMAVDNGWAADIQLTSEDSELVMEQLQSLKMIEKYLHDIRSLLALNKLRDADMDTVDEIKSMATKRLSPSGFYGVRGKRTDQDDYSAVDTTQKEKLQTLVNYFQYMHQKRLAGSQLNAMLKRGPPSGFHAVRGKRSIHEAALS